MRKEADESGDRLGPAGAQLARRRAIRFYPRAELCECEKETEGGRPQGGEV
jgi:hypothetical protein